MKLIDKSRAETLLNKSIDEGEAYHPFSSDIDKWRTWGRDIKIRVDAIFGLNSSQAFELSSLLSKFREQPDANGMNEKAKPILSLLRSLLTEVTELWIDEEPKTKIIVDEENTHPIIDTKNIQVFIVHGHDHGRMQTVARYIEHLGLEAIILHERPNKGDTIIEKLERHSKAIYAIVLLTPDDVCASSSDHTKQNFRARQNVIMELGYFLAKLGRKRTATLFVEEVEIPSDYSGILYIPMDKGDEWKLILAREMKASGINIDMNKVV